MRLAVTSASRRPIRTAAKDMMILVVLTDFPLAMTVSPEATINSSRSEASSLKPFITSLLIGAAQSQEILLDDLAVFSIL